MTKNRWNSVSYHRNPRLTFSWHLIYDNRCFSDGVYNTKQGFKFKVVSKRKARGYKFIRHMRTSIPYPPKYNFRMVYRRIIVR